MRNKIIFLLLIILFSLPLTKVFSQEEKAEDTKKKKSISLYVEFGVGVSIPQISPSASPYKEGMGYSHTGVVADFNAVMRIKKFWGIKYNISLMFCPVDKEYVLHNHSYGYKNNLFGSWVNIHLGISPFLRLKKDNYAFEFGMSTGLLTASAPTIKHVVLSDGKVLSTKNLHSGLGLGFSIIPNIAAYYKISKKNYLKIFVNYLISPIKIKYDDMLLGQYESKYTLSNFNFGVGITF